MIQVLPRIELGLEDSKSSVMTDYTIRPEMGEITRNECDNYKWVVFFFCDFSAYGTRTRVGWVKASYPNHLD